MLTFREKDGRINNYETNGNTNLKTTQDNIPILLGPSKYRLNYNTRNIFIIWGINDT